MNYVLVPLWILMPCTSQVTMDMTSHSTIVISCPNTFGEVYGPFLPKGWKKPHKVKPEVVVPVSEETIVKSVKKKHYHKRKHKHRRRHK
jgi:hypothetical protein